jgi:hypothetical protein
MTRSLREVEGLLEASEKQVARQNKVIHVLQVRRPQHAQLRSSCRRYQRCVGVRRAGAARVVPPSAPASHQPGFWLAPASVLPPPAALNLLSTRRARSVSTARC